MPPMNVRVTIDILDEDAVTQAQIVHLFTDDAELFEFLTDIHRTKMQRIFDRLRAGKYSRGKLVTNPNSVHAQHTGPSGVKRPKPRPLYDIASAACYERTKITITHI